jgi:hypothetical protein
MDNNQLNNNAGFIKNLLNRAKRLLLNPQTEYIAIEKENTSHTKILTHYVLPLMVIPVIFVFIGYGLIGVSYEGYYVNDVELGLRYAVLQIILLLGSIYISTLIINALSVKFGSTKNFNSAFALVAYAYTPIFFAGILFVWTEILWLIYPFGIYGFYLLIVGLKPMMKPANEKADSYSAISWIAVIVYVGLLKALEAVILPSMVAMPSFSIPSYF